MQLNVPAQISHLGVFQVQLQSHALFKRLGYSRAGDDCQSDGKGIAEEEAGEKFHRCSEDSQGLQGPGSRFPSGAGAEVFKIVQVSPSRALAERGLRAPGVVSPNR